MAQKTNAAAEVKKHWHQKALQEDYGDYLDSSPWISYCDFLERRILALSRGIFFLIFLSVVSCFVVVFKWMI